MNLLGKLLLSPWFWADIFLSISGGAIVYWGLLIEKRAEKLLPPEDFRPDIFDDVVRQQKSELERGWRILMTGIVVEVVAALLISIISGLEVARLHDQTADANLEAKQAGTNAAASYEHAAIAEKEAAQANQLAAEYNERSKQLESTNVQLSLKVEELRSTNLVLEARVFDLEAQMKNTISIEAAMGENLNETRNFVNESNTTIRLNEAKDVVATASKVAADVGSIVTNNNFNKLSQLKPKSLQERIIDCLNSIDKSIVPRLAKSTTSAPFSGEMEHGTWVELNKLATEPGAWQYLQIQNNLHGGAMTMDGTVLTKDIKFWLYPALLKEE